MVSIIRFDTGESSPGANWVGFTKTLAITRSQVFSACLTSARWPSCSAPIVGTQPMHFP